MNDIFKEWCYHKVYPTQHIPVNLKLNLELLIKTMWQINREGKWFITNDFDNNYAVRNHMEICLSTEREYFLKKDYNNSEQKALTESLKYIYDARNKE